MLRARRNGRNDLIKLLAGEACIITSSSALRKALIKKSSNEKINKNFDSKSMSNMIGAPYSLPGGTVESAAACRLLPQSSLLSLKSYMDHQFPIIGVINVLFWIACLIIH